jgi:arylsulfatase A-like enzyme
LRAAAPLSRRDLLLGGFGLGALAACRQQAPATAPRGRRSVLLLAVDDLNDWVCELSDYPSPPTPNLRRLVARGTLFTRAYAAAAACNPSRASLLTGLPPWELGLYDNRTALRSVAPDVSTLPQVFAAHGYRTVGCGKIFHGSHPDPASWHDFVPTPAEKKPPGRPLARLAPGPAAQATPGQQRLFDWGPTSLAPAETSDGQLVRLAASRLATTTDPLFLAVGFAKPHLPWYLPERYFEAIPLETVQLPPRRPDDLDDVPAVAREGVERQRIWPELVTDDEAARRAVQAYLAAIALVDEQLGVLLDAWDESPHADGGVIALWSDQGFHLGEKSHWRKKTLWQEATHVPMVVAAAGTGRPGERSPQPVSLLDLFPTLLELCALPTPAGRAGHSLVPTLSDPGHGPADAVVSAGGPGDFAVCDRRWRYVRHADGSEELYDHEHDPHEWTNLAADPSQAATRRRLAAALPARWTPAPTPAGGADAGEDDG